MKTISGGVTAPKGFRAAAVHAGVKSQDPAHLDLALILSDVPCAAAGVYTRNRVKAAPVYVTRTHLADGTARGVIVNSGNANACAPNSHEHAEAMCTAAARALGLETEDFAVASTGVIGQELNIACIEAAVPALVSALAATEEASDAAARAILTTDTHKKERAIEFTVDGVVCRMGTIAKGSGMIHPNMGTTLSFLTTDCAISAQLLQKALSDVIRVTMNRVSIDGDTSTNDTCLLLANGQAGNAEITAPGEAYDAFHAALLELLMWQARQIAGDGEGATRLVTAHVTGARSEEAAETLAKAIIHSSLVKAAMFGADANWGRVICAMGYAKAPFFPEYVDIAFSSAAGSIEVCRQERGLPFDEELAKQILTQEEVVIEVDVHDGASEATAWGCDLSYDYVKINGDYRT